MEEVEEEEEGKKVEEEKGKEGAEVVLGQGQEEEEQEKLRHLVYLAYFERCGMSKNRPYIEKQREDISGSV